MSPKEEMQKQQHFAQMQSSNGCVVGVSLLVLLGLVHLITLRVLIFLITQEDKR